MISQTSTIQLTFSFEAGVYQDPYERYPFWNLPSTREFFMQHGYTLYDYIEDGTFKQALPSEAYCEARYPYAYHDDEVFSSIVRIGDPKLVAADATGKIVFAQDSSNRHVVIKVVHANTEEYRVLKFLTEQSLETLEENCVIPVLELLANGKYWFAVMPRWGEDVYYPDFTRLCEVIDIIRCMLNGMVFLHKNNICHGDIDMRNVLVNHFSNMQNITSCRNRRELRLDRRLSYALIDFDFSALLPARDSRLPYGRSWGTFNLTEDTRAGEFDYDPFAFDVGAMGVTFCTEYQVRSDWIVSRKLAPLLDMMTTWNVRGRFTAIQALEFFEAHVSELTEDELQADVSTVKCPQLSYNEYDRWQNIPPGLAERWKMYWETPRPWTRRFLRAICSRQYWRHIVPWTRWICFQAFSAFPRWIYRWLLSKISL